MYSECLSKFLGCAGKDISHPTYCSDQAARALQLFAQMADVHIQKAVVWRRLPLKQRRRNLIPRNHPACRAHQHLQQIELGRSQLHQLVVQPYLARRRIHANVADHNVFRIRPRQRL